MHIIQYIIYLIVYITNVGIFINCKFMCELKIFKLNKSIDIYILKNV